jgi:hypothetical protein
MHLALSDSTDLYLTKVNMDFSILTEIFCFHSSNFFIFTNDSHFKLQKNKLKRMFSIPAEKNNDVISNLRFGIFRWQLN